MGGLCSKPSKRLPGRQVVRFTSEDQQVELLDEDAINTVALEMIDCWIRNGSTVHFGKGGRDITFCIHPEHGKIKHTPHIVSGAAQELDMPEQIVPEEQAAEEDHPTVISVCVADIELLSQVQNDRETMEARDNLSVDGEDKNFETEDLETQQTTVEQNCPTTDGACATSSAFLEEECENQQVTEGNEDVGGNANNTDIDAKEGNSNGWMTSDTGGDLYNGTMPQADEDVKDTVCKDLKEEPADAAPDSTEGISELTSLEAKEEESKDVLSNDSDVISRRPQPIGLDGGEAEGCNIAGVVHGGMGNTTDVSDNTFINENVKPSETEDDFFDTEEQKEEEEEEPELAGNLEFSQEDTSDGTDDHSEGVPTAVKGGKATDSNIAGVVYGGMGNTESISGNKIVNTATTNKGKDQIDMDGDTEQENKGQAMGVTNQDITGSNIAGKVHGGVGNTLEMLNNEIFTNQGQASRDGMFEGSSGKTQKIVNSIIINFGDSKKSNRARGKNENVLVEGFENDITDVDENGNTVLHIACMLGQMRCVEYVLGLNKLSLDARGQNDRTPVMMAARYGHSGVFDLLVAKECNLLLEDVNRETVLHLASEGGNVTIVQSILSLHVLDINAKGKRRLTPVMIAAKGGQKGVFDLLVKQSSDLSGEIMGGDILHLACSGGSAGIVQHVLSQQTIDLDRQGQFGRTPVMMAAGSGHKHVFQLLVKRGANLQVTMKGGDNILHVACLGGNVDIVKMVVGLKKFSINQKGQLGRTPVMKAASKGHKKIFSFLVDQKCDLSVVDAQGNNLLHVACLGGDADIVKSLMSAKVGGIDSRGQYGSTPVMKAAMQGHKAVFDLLVKQGCDLSVVDQQGRSCHDVAISGGNYDIIKYFLGLGRVQIFFPGTQPPIPLHRPGYPQTRLI